MPFSFNEILKYENFEDKGLSETHGLILNLLRKYFESGGFPEIVVKNYEYRSYLSIMVDDIIFRDIVSRYKIREINGLKNLL